jgi:GNAT superfamily N-acetyltransferase
MTITTPEISTIVASPSLLTAAHFDEGQVRLTEAGLSYNQVIDQDARDHSAAWETDNAPDRRTWVIANPATPSLSELRARVKEWTAANRGKDVVNPLYGLQLKDEYDRTWLFSDEEGKRDRVTSESQELVLVAFDAGGRPAGYAALQVSVTHYPADRDIFLACAIEHIYVAPAERGKGYGIDLSVATETLFVELLRAIYRAAPEGTQIHPSIHADLVGKTDRAIVDSIHSGLSEECSVIGYGEDGGSVVDIREDITVRDCGLDAGY